MGRRSIAAQKECQKLSKNINPISGRLNNRIAVTAVNPETGEVIHSISNTWKQGSAR